ncbi:MAG: AAA family ATPase [Candidatus Improbicoccus pseudotrichonymphae]|uniref:AAA family ATPase n=1 Tax=Candidatus Improbicoccus pseudotrichonymphae TaxID=3033792 RepID=A0AA48I0X5_9FIRM|nr:MAG: AAA family ATPase [Candidatus Improbicoccus pseudotrichonymphae]
MFLWHKRIKKFFSFICVLSLMNGLNPNISTSAFPFMYVSDEKAEEIMGVLDIKTKAPWEIPEIIKTIQKKKEEIYNVINSNIRNGYDISLFGVNGNLIGQTNNNPNNGGNLLGGVFSAFVGGRSNVGSQVNYQAVPLPPRNSGESFFIGMGGDDIFENLCEDGELNIISHREDGKEAWGSGLTISFSELKLLFSGCFSKNKELKINANSLLNIERYDVFSADQKNDAKLPYISREGKPLEYKDTTIHSQSSIDEKFKDYFLPIIAAIDFFSKIEFGLDNKISNSEHISSSFESEANMHWRAIVSPVDFIYTIKNRRPYPGSDHQTRFAYIIGSINCRSFLMDLFSIFVRHLVQINKATMKNKRISVEQFLSPGIHFEFVENFFPVVPRLDRSIMSYFGEIFGENLIQGTLGALSNVIRRNNSDESDNPHPKSGPVEMMLNYYLVSSCFRKFVIRNRKIIVPIFSLIVVSTVKATTVEIAKFLSKSSANLISTGVVLTEEFGKKVLISISKVKNSPVKLRALVKDILSKTLVGRTKLVDMLSKILSGAIVLGNSPVSNKQKCVMLSFFGPPGTGKTFIANNIAIILTGRPINPVLSFNASTLENIDFKKYFAEGSFPYRVVVFSRGVVVILIDEIDKITPEKRIEILNALRDVVDYGHLKIEKIGGGFTNLNLNGSVVIFTSNTTASSWHTKTDEPEDQHGVVYQNIDESFATRCTCCHLPFFRLEEYIEMFRRAISQLNAHFERIESGIRISVDDETLRLLAQNAVDVHQGARSVERRMVELVGLLTEFNPSAANRDNFTNRIGNFFSRRRERIEVIELRYNRESDRLFLNNGNVEPLPNGDNTAIAAITTDNDDENPYNGNMEPLPNDVNSDNDDENPYNGNVKSLPNDVNSDNSDNDDEDPLYNLRKLPR